MTQADFMQRRFFTKQELNAHANGLLLDRNEPNYGLITPLLPFDRIVSIGHDGNSGHIIAEQDTCISYGLDPIWQLLAFYLSLRGAPSNARPLGCKEVDCSGQIRSYRGCLRYQISVTLVTHFRQSATFLAVGDGVILARGESIFSVREAQVGASPEIHYADDPSSSRDRASAGYLEALG